MEDAAHSVDRDLVILADGNSQWTDSSSVNPCPVLGKVLGVVSINVPE